MAKIGDFARTEPELFIDVYENQETPRKAILKEALDTEVITHDSVTGQVKMGGQLIATFKTDTAASFLDEFSRHLGVSENGADVLKNIESQLAKKKEKTAK